MKLLKRLFLFIMVLGFAIKPVLAVTYHFYQNADNYEQTIEELNVGDIVKPSDVFNFKNWRTNYDLERSLTINYFEEESNEAFTFVDNQDDTLPSYTTNVYSDTVNDFSENPDEMNEHDFTIKTIEQTGLNIPSSKNGIPFNGWKVAYLKPSQYHSAASFINLVPDFGYDHKIVSHPTTSNPTLNVTSESQVSNYYFAQFDKIDGLKTIDFDNTTTFNNSMVNTDNFKDLPENVTTTKNSLRVIPIANNELLNSQDNYNAYVGYFEITNDNNISISIDYKGFPQNDYISIEIYDVSKALDSNVSLYDQIISSNQIPLGFFENEQMYKNTVTSAAIFETDSYSINRTDEDYGVPYGSYNNYNIPAYHYNSTIDLSSLNLKQGLYKIYINSGYDYIAEGQLENNNLDINDFGTNITFNNFNVFSMNNFEWLNKGNNEDTSSPKLATKFMNSSKSYIAQAKYKDGYTLTSKTFGAESKSIVESAIEAVSNTIVKAGDNITLVLLILASVTTMLFIFKRKIKKC